MGQLPARRAARRRIASKRLPLLNDDVDAVAVRGEHHQHITVTAARDLRVAVVPQPCVLVELKRQERVRAGRPEEPGGRLAREPQIHERVRPRLINRRPPIEDVGLGRADTARLGRQSPRSRHLLLRAADERGVRRVGIGTVHHPARRLQPLPVHVRDRIGPPHRPDCRPHPETCCPPAGSNPRGPRQPAQRRQQTRPALRQRRSPPPPANHGIREPRPRRRPLPRQPNLPLPRRRQQARKPSPRGRHSRPVAEPGTSAAACVSSNASSGPSSTGPEWPRSSASSGAIWSGRRRCPSGTVFAACSPAAGRLRSFRVGRPAI